MAQQGRNGQYDESLNDGTQYIFNPMAFPYHQNQVITPPTVLSQQDANLMANFFDNPDTAPPSDSYLTFGLEPRTDPSGNSDAMADGGMSLPNTTIAHVSTEHGMYGNNMMQARTAFPSHDFSNVFLQNHSTQNQRHNSGDAVEGASVLMNLSTTTDQNLLGANNFMTWGNIVGSQTVTGPNRQNAARAAPIKSNSASQLQTQFTPPSQPNSWAEITNQTHLQRMRHPSLQLDTATNVFPSHQSTWQNAPQSALPQAKQRNRPGMVTFGSDNRFGSQGFAGSTQHSPEPRFMHMANIGDIAIPSTGVPSSNDIHQLHAFQQRHSIAAPQHTSHSAQSSPAIGGLPTPANSVGGLTSQPQQRKRGPAHMDDDNEQRGDSGEVPVNKQSKRRKSSAHQAPAVAEDTLSASQEKSTLRNRRGGRDAKAPRQNLTDEQKRNNHIASEQKRRDAMKSNFEELNKLVPALMTGGAGLSRSEILQHTGNALESLKSGNAVISQLLGVDLSSLDVHLDPDDEDAVADDDVD